MIKEFVKGHHQEDLELQEDYLDWFFLSHFGKGIGYWRDLPSDKIEAILTLEEWKENKYWENWMKIYSKIYGK